jgi:ADP-ribose pyrophosphatase
MTRPLTQQQIQALDSYFDLMAAHPELFSGRSLRPIVRVREALEAFAAENSVVLGIAARTPYLWLVNDLVESRRTAERVVRHPYLRLIAPPEALGVHGVVVLATVRDLSALDEARVVLVEQERHATGTVEVELPRGFGEPGSTAQLHALRELAEETGYVGEAADYLGTTLTDNGISDSAVSYFHVSVTGRAAAAEEPAEAISRLLLLTPEQVWARITAGAIRDGFTVQALSLYERWLHDESKVDGDHRR